MTQTSPLGRRRGALGQAIIPLALLALVGFVGGLVLHARSLEASHRATAESALRDYAALAAWQYAKQADSYVSNSAHMTLNVVQPLLHRLAATGPLPPPDTLVRFGDANACGIGSTARFAFRLDLPSRQMIVAGAAPDSSVRAAIAERFAALVGTEATQKEIVRMFVDTVGGAARAIAYGVVRGLDRVPRAVYGVESDPSALTGHLRDVPKNNVLLPPSLLRGVSTDSLLMVEVHRADGGLLVTRGSAPKSTLVAEEKTSIAGGNLTAKVTLRPEAASLLLIGGVPSSDLNALILLLAASVIMAGVALYQIRRGRELAQLRTRFVANVSHELRTPLAQISMFSETLLLGRERSAREGQEFLSIIFRETQRLRHLVESVLRFSRTEANANRNELHLELDDVAGEVRDAARAFAPLAAAARVELSTELQDGCMALVDRHALRQVLLNLLDNAVKFGPAGQTVVVSVNRFGEEVVISVTDEGPGIPPPERRRVFEPFTQVASTHSRTTTGAGIGLAVVADVVAAHRGRVWIDDGPGGRGAWVSIALPAVDVGMRVRTTASVMDAARESDEALILQ